MQPFKPYFVGAKQPPAKRVVSVQKVLRAGGKDTDLEDVGRTDRHCSFFEMLGNFSFGDYFKDDAVAFAWEFVTAEWASRRTGSGRPCTRAIRASSWTRTRSRSRRGSASAIAPDRIVRLGKDNFWQAADTGPAARAPRSSSTAARCTAAAAPTARPGCECDRYMEFYNLVFMEYELRPGPDARAAADPERRHRPRPRARRDVPPGRGSNFDTDGFRAIMDWVTARRASPRARATSPRSRTACSPTTPARWRS